MKPMLESRLPRLYVFIIIMVALFSLLNVLILFYGRNLFIYYSAIWSWSIILLLALAGTMLIGMALSHRLFTFREFTPFERDMMEMRLEVKELKEMLTAIQERLGTGEGVDNPGAPGPVGQDGDGGDGGIDGEDEGSG